MDGKKKWLAAFGLTVATGLVGMAALVAWIDPFFQYHKPLKWFPYLIENQLCQNPGIAKQFEYDSVLLGSSMTVNFNTLWFDEYFGLNTVKLTYNAARPLDQDTILEVIEKYHGEVEAVFLGVDVTTYSRPVDERAYELQTYLYDDNLLNDVNYWWNKDVLLNYVLEPFCLKKEMDDIHTLYNKWYDPGQFSAPKVLESYSPSKGIGGDLDNVTRNMEEHILPYIREHRDTQWYVFFPPYSILFWHSALQEGEVDARLAEYRTIVETLLECDNVQVYFFANDADIICNLDNYSDYTHYSREVSLYVTRCMAEGKKRLTSENYEEELEKLKALAEGFDFGIWGL